MSTVEIPVIEPKVSGGELHVAHSAEQERYRLLLVRPGAALDDADWVGYLDYMTEIDHQVVLTHTVIPQAHEGRGYAAVLVRSVLDDIRSSGRKVVPVCSYVSIFIDNNPEYAELVDHPAGP